MIFATRSQQGFTLVELAIVMLIMGLVIGGLAMPLAVQRENARIRDGQAQLDAVLDAVEGFALVNGYLPCPATPASSWCSLTRNFVPGTKCFPLSSAWTVTVLMSQ